MGYDVDDMTTGRRLPAGIAGNLTDVGGEVVADGREPKQCHRKRAILANAAVSSLSP